MDEEYMRISERMRLERSLAGNAASAMQEIPDDTLLTRAINDVDSALDDCQRGLYDVADIALSNASELLDSMKSYTPEAGKLRDVIRMTYQCGNRESGCKSCEYKMLLDEPEI